VKPHLGYRDQFSPAMSGQGEFRLDQAQRSVGRRAGDGKASSPGDLLVPGYVAARRKCTNRTAQRQLLSQHAKLSQGTAAEPVQMLNRNSPSGLLRTCIKTEVIPIRG